MESKAENGSEAHRPTAITDATAEFEEYTAPPRVDEHGRPLVRSKGLGASGYQFPPPGGPQPPLTKANLAKGIGVPEVPRSPSTATAAAWPVPALPGQGSPSAAPGPAPAVHAAHPRAGDRGVPGTLVRQLTPAPIERAPPVPAVKVEESELFEEYRRPDHDKQPPRTGKGLRTEPPGPPSAKELLKDFHPAAHEPEVVTPKRFGVMFSPSPGTASAPGATGDGPSEPLPTPAQGSAPTAAPAPAIQVAPAASAPKAPVYRVSPTRPVQDKDSEQAEIDARSDLAAAPTAGMAMSSSSQYGPIKTVIHHDDDEREETLTKSAVYLPPESPGIKAAPAAPTMQPMPPASASRPHLPDLPALARDGPVPRIGIVQAQFNTDITNAMLASAQAEALRLGVPVAAVVQVPGVYDTSLAAKRLLSRPDIDAVVVLGCVIQGETGHDQLITNAAAQTLLAIACSLDKPVGLGITGPRMTRAQAEARIESAAFAVASVVAQHRVLKVA